jgi:hypothetical protein
MHEDYTHTQLRKREHSPEDLQRKYHEEESEEKDQKHEDLDEQQKEACPESLNDQNTSQGRRKESNTCLLVRKAIEISLSREGEATREKEIHGGRVVRTRGNIRIGAHKCQNIIYARQAAMSCRTYRWKQMNGNLSHRSTQVPQHRNTLRGKRE